MQQTSRYKKLLIDFISDLAFIFLDFASLQNVMYSLKYFLAVIIFILTCTGCSQRVTDHEQVNPKDKIIIKFSHVVAENTPKGLAAQRFANIVHARTGGRVEVQVFPNSTLYADGEEMEALKSGAVQIIAPHTSKISDMFPKWQIFDLPFAFDNRLEVYAAVDGEIGKKLTKELPEQNLLALAFWDNGFKQMTNDVRPLIRPQDFRGLNFRVMINSNVLKEQFRLLGARPVELPFNCVYKALQTGEVDGQENTMSNIYSKKFYQLQPYLTVSNHGYIGYVVITNKTFWEGLPPDIRNILKDVMAEVTQWERTQAAELNAKNYKQIKNLNCVEIHELTEEEKQVWKNTFKPLYNSFKPVIGEDLINNLNL